MVTVSGCPSPTVAKEGEVSSWAFGAALMKEPSRVADIAGSMIRESGLPVSVKCRIGVDDMDSYERLHEFVRIVSTSGVRHFVVHARIALLKGKRHTNLCVGY
jgi:tRNA-dihydrouridine synthase A